MPSNGSVKGLGGPAPLTPDTGTSIPQPSQTGVPQRGGATIRPRTAGGPPARANSLQASSGNRPQGGVLPQRRATMPSSLPCAAPLVPPTPAFPPLAAAEPDAAPPHGEADELRKQLDSLLESQARQMEKYIELTNKATDGVGAAVSARLA